MRRLCLPRRRLGQIFEPAKAFAFSNSPRLPPEMRRHGQYAQLDLALAPATVTIIVFVWLLYNV